ncbi:MAG: 2Fe-2S iron-sulfur cluster-binding protein [Alphaproteobacteria bacterium]|jgi:succinate dehydrogenase/fumarate reductase-like Fe-S protein|nr:2Fe-2S iron-sulfur cluster-binding protein [Alphaproteobacteria bacterium]
MSEQQSVKQTANLKVRRGGPEQPIRHETFDFPFEDGQSVLDALRWIRGNKDASLAVRYSCISANACKECVMRIDGKTGYACTTPLINGEMLIEPLPNKRLIRDLVTDTLPPDERL